MVAGKVLSKASVVYPCLDQNQELIKREFDMFLAGCYSTLMDNISQEENAIIS